jgi:nicotinate-nucleotide adenylyltransferase
MLNSKFPITMLNSQFPMQKIALFGTSADPPTAGHKTILSWLSQHFDWVAVWASDNPFKSHETSLEHRSAMLLLMIQEINSPRHNLCLYPELSSPRTLETVEKAKLMWEDADLTLVIGADLVGQLPRWYKIEQLLTQVQLLIVPRPGYPQENLDLWHLRRMGAEVAIASLNSPNVSSTSYRETGDLDALTPPIEAYINREHLYAWHEAQKRAEVAR